MTIAALIFDVDGTLADTEEGHRCAFNAAFERYRLGWNWDRGTYRQLLKTTGGKERIGAYLASLPLPAAEKRRLGEMIPAIHAEKTRFYSSVVADGAIPLREGVARLCEEALTGGARLAIASTTSAANVDALLGANFGPSGLSMFDVIACGDAVPKKKPAPDIYELALRHLGEQPARSIAIEDSLNGLRSASAAGLWTLITPTYWTEDEDFDGAGLVLPSLGDPGRPIEGEPGRRLKQAGWLRFDELVARAEAAAHAGARG